MPGCLHILPRWPQRKSSQPQVQETNPLLKRWLTLQPPTHQKCMPAPAAATRAWSSNGSSRAAGLQGSPLPAYQRLSRSSCLFPRSQHTVLLWLNTQHFPESFPLDERQSWNECLSYSSFPFSQIHVLKREYVHVRAQLLNWHSHFKFTFPKKSMWERNFWTGILTLMETNWRSILPYVSCVPRSAFLLPRALCELFSRLPIGQLQR